MKRLLVGGFNEYCKFSQNDLTCCILIHIAEDMQGFQTLSVLDNSTYEPYQMDIKHMLRKARKDYEQK